MIIYECNLMSNECYSNWSFVLAYLTSCYVVNEPGVCSVSMWCCALMLDVCQMGRLVYALSSTTIIKLHPSLPSPVV